MGSDSLVPANKRTHRCHKCNKEYSKTSHLRAHLRGHENNRPYECDFKGCCKRFTRSDELKRHRRIHSDERNFVCPVCKKRFLRSDHLQKHFLTHIKPNLQLDGPLGAAAAAAAGGSSTPTSLLQQYPLLLPTPAASFASKKISTLIGGKL